MTDGIPHVTPMPRHKNRDKYTPRPMASCPSWITRSGSSFRSVTTVLAMGDKVKQGETWEVSIDRVGASGRVVWVYPIKKIIS